MLFNSYVFWAFLAVVLPLYWLLGRGAAGGRAPRAQNLLLLVASYVFYGAWDWRFLGLIWISTAVDYVAALSIEHARTPRARDAWLATSVAMNLGLLGMFKYYDFFVTEGVHLLTLVGIDAHPPLLRLVLPVGISFYTFQTMSYTIDVYRGATPAQRDPLDFALYVCFFPQLVAGPIERSGDLMPQVERARRVTAARMQEGLYHVLLGYVKKVVLADNMAPVANALFASPVGSLSGPECAAAVYAFAMQVYGDFSGYSSIAKGVAKWMGFELMDNFRMPYFSYSPSDFWRRWHISLSQWLRDYLYIPLGGNRGGPLATTRNLMLTMTLGGLWHGASLTFLAWGVYQGAILCLYRPIEPWLRRRVAANPLARAVAVLLMFHLACAGWLLFRATTVGQAAAMAHAWVTDGAGWRALAAGEPSSWAAAAALGMVAVFAGPLLLYEAWVERRGDLDAILDAPWQARAALYTALVVALWFFAPPTPSVFLYFQF